MDPKNNEFEQIYFNPYPRDDSHFENGADPDLHYFNDLTYDTPYVFQEEIKNTLFEIKQHENISFLHFKYKKFERKF